MNSKKNTNTNTNKKIHISNVESCPQDIKYSLIDLAPLFPRINHQIQREIQTQSQYSSDRKGNTNKNTVTYLDLDTNCFHQIVPDL